MLEPPLTRGELALQKEIDDLFDMEKPEPAWTPRGTQERREQRERDRDLALSRGNSRLEYWHYYYHNVAKLDTVKMERRRKCSREYNRKRRAERESKKDLLGV